MSHGPGQKYAPAPPAQVTTEDQPFEFKPLDLKSPLNSGEKRTRRIRVPCTICGRPGCFYEREVEVEDP